MKTGNRIGGTTVAIATSPPSWTFGPRTRKLTKYEDIPCCPSLDTSPVCDVIDMRRRLVFPTKVQGPNDRPVWVEVIVHTRFTALLGSAGTRRPRVHDDAVARRTGPPSHDGPPQSFQFRQRVETQLSQRANVGGAVPHDGTAHFLDRSECDGSWRRPWLVQWQLGFSWGCQRRPWLLFRQRGHQCARQPQRPVRQRLHA